MPDLHEKLSLVEWVAASKHTVEPRGAATCAVAGIESGRAANLLIAAFGELVDRLSRTKLAFVVVARC